ncbi:MAG: PD-(D/E)XK motif protein [Sneathiellaceae bacterium]
MTGSGLFTIYNGVAIPRGDGSGAPFFAVRCVPGHDAYFVGKDVAGQACLLVETKDGLGRKPPPIRLESLDAQFELECQISDAGSPARVGLFTVVRCRSPVPETIRYFLSVCRIIMRHLGPGPSRYDLAAAVRRLASIFQNIQKPPVRSLNGLFGELFVISRSRSPVRAVAAWRVDETSRFDFATGDIRIDVKSCAGRIRKHIFSYDQCNPPTNTHAVVASLMVERVPGGISIDDLMASIEVCLSGDPELVLKLHNILASTLGAELTASLHVTFDKHLADSSLQFFDLRTIPAVRDSIPSRVSDVRFAVDLSGLTPLSLQNLTDRDPYFWDLVPVN